ncbi:MAG: recombination mediator RecR [Gammaproteobacteria bacterium]|nr:recombination mediator RecR [Gammaproteobacteria bacterium]
MAEHSPLLTELIDSLKLLPGVGQKSAQRMALHLLKIEQDKSIKLGQVICKAVESIKHCSQCRNYTEEKVCEICNSPNRKSSQMCIVETPTDLMAIENGTIYNGVYFVLMGKLSPLDGIGPEKLGLDILEDRLKSGNLEEIILATSSTMEGEVTAHVIAEMVKKNGLKTTRLAQGVPIGGELEYLDLNTLSQAFETRTEYD